MLNLLQSFVYLIHQFPLLFADAVLEKEKTQIGWEFCCCVQLHYVLPPIPKLDVMPDTFQCLYMLICFGFVAVRK